MNCATGAFTPALHQRSQLYPPTTVQKKVAGAVVVVVVVVGAITLTNCRVVGLAQIKLPPPHHLSILQRGNHPRNDVRGTAMPLMCSRPIVVRPPRNDMIITSSGSENEILGKKK